MATVVFGRGLARGTGDIERVDIEATDVRALIRALDDRFPGIATELREGRTAIAIDGDIVHEPLLEAIEPDSEVHFLPPISGG